MSNHEPASSPPSPTYELYSYYRSSCSARVRIAAHLKLIPLTYKFIHLLKAEQLASDYCADINPSGSIPTLVVTQQSSPTPPKALIRQSVAILEYLDEVHPNPSLLGTSTGQRPDPLLRARIRELANIIACDIQPVTNLRIIKRIRELAPNDPQAVPRWQKEFMTNGLKAYEQILASSSASGDVKQGKYSVGDSVTMADVCLAPAVDGAD